MRSDVRSDGGGDIEGTASGLGLDPGRLREAYEQIPIMSDAQISLTLDEVQTVVEYLADLAQGRSIHQAEMHTSACASPGLARPSRTDERDEFRAWVNARPRSELVLRVLLPFLERLGYGDFQFPLRDSAASPDLVCTGPDPLGNLAAMAVEIVDVSRRDLDQVVNERARSLARSMVAGSGETPWINTPHLNTWLLITACELEEHHRRATTAACAAGGRTHITLMDRKELANRVIELAPELMCLARDRQLSELAPDRDAISDDGTRPQ